MVEKKVKAKILLPVEGNAINFLGVSVDDFDVKLNYRDCAKVIVTASASKVNELQAKSRAYFEKHWPQRRRDDE